MRAPLKLSLFGLGLAAVFGTAAVTAKTPRQPIAASIRPAKVEPESWPRITATRKRPIAT